MLMAVAMIVAVGMFVPVFMVMVVRMLVFVRVRMRVIMIVAMYMIMVVAVSLCLLVLVLVVMSVVMPMRVAVLMLVIVPMSMRVVVRMVAVMVVRVPMIVLVAMVMGVRMTMTLCIDLLCERVVFSKRLVVAMLMTAAIRAGLGCERCFNGVNTHAQTTQHVGEDRIALDLQIPIADFNRGVPVSKVISRTHQSEGRCACDQQHGFRRGLDDHHRAVFGDEHIAICEDGPARQHDADLFARIELRGKPALAPFVKSQRQRLGAREQRLRDARAGRNKSVQGSHSHHSGGVQESLGDCGLSVLSPQASVSG